MKANDNIFSITSYQLYTIIIIIHNYYCLVHKLVFSTQVENIFNKPQFIHQTVHLYQLNSILNSMNRKLWIVKIEFSPINVYYWLIILLIRLFFPTCNLFSFSSNQIWSFLWSEKKKTWHWNLFSLGLFLVSFLIHRNMKRYFYD